MTHRARRQARRAPPARRNRTTCRKTKNDLRPAARSRQMSHQSRPATGCRRRCVGDRRLGVVRRAVGGEQLIASASTADTSEAADDAVTSASSRPLPNRSGSRLDELRRAPAPPPPRRPPRPAGAESPRATTTSAPAATGERPMGVTVLAILAAIAGVFGIFGSVLLLGLGGAAGIATGSAALGGLVASHRRRRAHRRGRLPRLRLGRLGPQAVGVDARHRYRGRLDRARPLQHHQRRLQLVDQHRDRRGDHVLPLPAGRAAGLRSRLTAPSSRRAGRALLPALRAFRPATPIPDGLSAR